MLFDTTTWPPLLAAAFHLFVGVSHLLVVYGGFRYWFGSPVAARDRLLEEQLAELRQLLHFNELRPHLRMIEALANAGDWRIDWAVSVKDLNASDAETRKVLEDKLKQQRDALKALRDYVKRWGPDGEDYKEAVSSAPRSPEPA